jgi:hypothetical protein
VIEISAADQGSITGTIMNCWQEALEDVGPAGMDQGKGGQYYPFVTRDKNRNPLDGAATYRLHVPPRPPPGERRWHRRTRSPSTVIVTCADGYRVAFAMAELDPGFTERVCISCRAADLRAFGSSGGPSHPRRHSPRAPHPRAPAQRPSRRLTSESPKGPADSRCSRWSSPRGRR